MNNRERVLAALEHRQPDKTPYHIGFTQVAHARMAEYYGDPQFEDKLGNCLAITWCEPAGSWREVARECLQGWYGNNTTAMGKWRVGGNIIDPRSVNVPSLAFIPAQDRIVPPGSALALARALPLHDIMTPAAGHIGMMAGSKAKTQVWPSIVTWLKQRATAVQAGDAAAR